jgi:hypothetical protein
VVRFPRFGMSLRSEPAKAGSEGLLLRWEATSAQAIPYRSSERSHLVAWCSETPGSYRPSTFSSSPGCPWAVPRPDLFGTGRRRPRRPCNCSCASIAFGGLLPTGRLRATLRGLTARAPEGGGGGSETQRRPPRGRLDEAMKQPYTCAWRGCEKAAMGPSSSPSRSHWRCCRPGCSPLPNSLGVAARARRA